MKAKRVFDLSSSLAPTEWKKIPEIAKAHPKKTNVEVQLYKVDKLNICYWMTGWGGVWTLASEYFYVEK